MSGDHDEETKKVQVTLDDGSLVTYGMRGLREDEIDSWAEFCASVFSYKAHPPPPSYFARHYHNDPLRDANLIRVMFTQEGEMVSSCRVFVKQISTGSSSSVEAGGIGEVCTHVQHRRRGLSKILLQNAMEIMRWRKSIKVSLLHAAPTFFPVYERGGNYQCTTSQWSLVPVLVDQLTPNSRHVRVPNFGEPRFGPIDTPRLQEIHREYSEKRFVGCILRSQEYWRDYLAKELEGSMRVLLVKNRPAAWISIRPRGNGRFQLREFGCEIRVVSTATAMCQLLADVLGAESSNVTLHLPTAVLQECKGADFFQWETVQEENDMGWMYRTLQDDGPSMVDLSKTIPHLIWPADSF
eukprot:CAMPEP_0116822472 /NCGR_PEP_ID=MMETSP0418-20121206/287_1 /TAXON_ID=1158023 /ORGANISM="Astrosyne radiata, Strain 13vi08-1A" /LENGTH=352 /DNA_ID=CAMNT_0004450589 /DNA_START=216 /DNA_END=1274 /DNA_ORIENTATION=-